METSFLANLPYNTQIQSFKSEKPILLKLHIEPWAFENIKDFFPNSSESDFLKLRHHLSDCIMKFEQLVSGKILLGTEIMIDFMNGLLIFEVKNYAQSFNQSQIEETYTLDLIKVELR